ncbi:MFS transporter [Neptunomonas japonica]|uniref:MFS transporter, NNP family, nitrate/nitrite transporter n=1 Tax=Neptunomonas japonica JAMM 1380 TaxID=1441457 RepID=A0A7R6PUM6_9GAMM|nr:MFS transporter [Neptunomonas japonica]BBB30800.1 MFS transporter, NNP family, nitrate/nitrite transporter [Neptunomonas japonica JAMM 1380]
MSDIKKWDVENEQFWESEGKRVATRNLWISIPSLLCGFAVWLYWGIIAVQMLNLGFPFEKAELFTLAAIAGLTGATLRIPSSFFIRIAGGRNTIVFTTALLMIPAIGAGFALQDQNTPLWVFQLLAFLSGIGGGNFASSMSNISFFFPKKQQGLALGLNAGLGNAGVTTMQILVPLVMTMGIFGGAPMILENTSGTLIGKIPAGSETYIHNAGFVWLLFLIPLAIVGWFGMNNLRTDDVSPDIGSPVGAMSKIVGLLLIGFMTAAAGLFIILPDPTGLGAPGWAKWPVIVGILFFTIMLMKMIPGDIKPNLQRQFKIFENKHTWVMSVIYTMTFGSFIGYSAGFALAIKVVFGYQHLMVDGVMTHNIVNANGPSALMYAWMGPFIGAFIRPIGGWMADKMGGARVTHYVSIVMIASALGVAYYLKAAYQSATPEEYFVPFIGLFLVLFAATGIGNGSTFRTIAMVFPKEQAGPALGWTSAVAAYGAFVIPKVFGEQIKLATPEMALYGFAVFYLLCLALNWWYYLGPKAEFKNP